MGLPTVLSRLGLGSRHLAGLLFAALVVRNAQDQAFGALDEAVAALPNSLRDALPGERPSWGALWYVKGKNGELKYYQDNADSSD
jgi:hypothetical protein